jgi:alcohol dehydrogenase
VLAVERPVPERVAQPESLPAFTYGGLATRVVMRAGAVDDLAQELDMAGITRAMLVCGPRTARSQLMPRIRERIGDRLVAMFDDVTQHADVAAVEHAAARASGARIDGLLAVGGGSASDSAKAIAIVLAEGGPLARHANLFTPPDRYVQRTLPHPKLPLIVVPTTASAAEVTPGLGIRAADGRKLLFWDPKLAPRTIVLDPLANVEVPAEVMATTGMNAVAHCVEGLYSRVHNPISDALAIAGLRALGAGLPAMVREPSSVEARAQVLTGAHLSGMVIANARVGIHHGVCHGLGSLGGLSHGVANAILLPHAMRFNRAVAYEALVTVAKAMGRDDAHATPDAAIECIVELQHAARVPTRLRDAGLDRSLFPQLVALALGDRGLYFNPRPASGDDVLALLEAAW